jgi:hypothetical protein
VAARQSLVGLVLIVDARRPDLDRKLLSSYFSGRPVLVLATKIDSRDGGSVRQSARSSATSQRRFRCTRRKLPSWRSRQRAASASGGRARLATWLGESSFDAEMRLRNQE